MLSSGSWLCHPKRWKLQLTCFSGHASRNSPSSESQELPLSSSSCKFFLCPWFVPRATSGHPQVPDIPRLKLWAFGSCCCACPVISGCRVPRVAGGGPRPSIPSPRWAPGVVSPPGPRATGTKWCQRQRRSWAIPRLSWASAACWATSSATSLCRCGSWWGLSTLCLPRPGELLTPYPPDTLEPTRILFPGRHPLARSDWLPAYFFLPLSFLSSPGHLMSSLLQSAHLNFLLHLLSWADK